MIWTEDRILDIVILGKMTAQTQILTNVSNKLLRGQNLDHIYVGGSRGACATKI